ncbi:MAG: type I 3-dehydroquinate dehydratase [Planctomycetes bacterium]|nr:type I 3-dehydroquinate dehydratase [Planctomycetota bacterium]
MPQIIASVFAESREQVLRQAAKAAMAGADWLELRLDRWPLNVDLRPAIAPVQLPVLATCHTPENGGRFRGTLGERRELLTSALLAGAQGLDLDLHDNWAPPAGRTRLRLLMRSFHSFTGVPRELPEIHRQLMATSGAVAKIAVTAHDLADAAPLLELLRGIDQAATPTVAFAMGRTAWPTRLLALCHGAPFVFGCIEAGEETAVGQVPVALLAGLYRARELGPATAIYGLLGNPALHSLGPWLHNRAFRRLGVDGVYLPFETSRPEAVVEMLPAARVRGLSVTAPFKATLRKRCERLSDDAAATDVVNTLVATTDDGRFVGFNTDIDGVRAALAPFVDADREVAGGDRDAVVLGAGGAARAAAIALLGMGFRVTMLGRTLDGVREFAATHGIRLGSLSQTLPDGLEPGVVVQATPLGSVGRDPEERPLPEWQPAPATIVLEMVYRPARTRFLRDAAAAGARTIAGVEMFLAQAAAQVRRFSGQVLAPDELRAFLAGVT